ncbi:MAG: HD domain-containing protein [Chloroflexi bacterium]|nr:HD domain-containing protein [Chloroflexota bacterium]MBT3671190.1 HD domain-containing protein [Chloroflexota bacterium]MBT4002528.1 HD domain-containing protein [Chloroflexota bacterium]MBT4304351.1 HD domain-containing protein [Chloroflexota bacterium]MBT4534370.1 HD domain-containing protein [Chloroflexota bacterium]
MAIEMALRLHKSLVRKTREIPYLAHLLAVTALVLQDGGSEDEAIAALLHDAPEDQGGIETLTLIQEKFGKNVFQIVEACSDTFDVPKPEWRPRKEAHLEEVKKASSSVHRVIAADKLHNARSLLRDLKEYGNLLWEKFNGGKEGSIWYLQSMHEILTEKHPGYLTDELGKVLKEIENFAN